MSKRILAILLACLMVCLLASCTQSKTSSTAASSKAASTAASSTASQPQKAPAELTVWLYDNPGTDDAAVAQYISELPSVKAINVTVNFRKRVNGEDYKQATTLALTTNEAIDILFDPQWVAYSSRVAQGAYADIGELLNTKYTKLKAAIPETHWSAATVNGKVFGVPTYKEAGEQWAVYAAEKLIKTHNIDTTKITQISDATELLKAMKEDGRAGFQVVVGDAVNMINLAKFHDFEIVAGNAVAIDRAAPDKVVNYYESQNFRDVCNLYRSWYEAGYIAQDVMTIEKYGDIVKNEDKCGMTLVSYSPQNEIAQKNALGFDMTPMPVTKAYVTTGACLGSMFCVNAKTKDLDSAVAFLEAWNTDPDVKNTICYGIKDTHYTLEDGQVKYIDGHSEKWTGQNWTTGNSFISYTMVGETKDKWDVYTAWNKEATPSALLGFLYNSDNTSAEEAAVTAAITEHLPALALGQIPADQIDAKIKEMNDALYAVGLQKIIDEGQKQVTEFLKK